jgi:ketosteroid isomerase-like protein
MSDENVAMIQQAIENFNRRDFDAALEAAADDFTWTPLLSRMETELHRGKESVKAAWQSQVEVLDLRVEPLDFIPVSANKIVVPAKLFAKGRSSGMPLTLSVVWVWTFGDDGLGKSIEPYETKAEALEAAGLSK